MIDPLPTARHEHPTAHSRRSPLKLRSLFPIGLLLAVTMATACEDAPPNAFMNLDDAAVADDLGTGECVLPNIRCGRVCANPAEDPANCGGCSINCGRGRVCVNGRCDNQCPESPVRQTRCDNRCTDTNVDR